MPSRRVDDRLESRTTSCPYDAKLSSKGDKPKLTTCMKILNANDNIATKDLKFYIKVKEDKLTP